MKYQRTLSALGAVLLAGFSLPASAGPGEEEVQQAAEAARQAAKAEQQATEAGQLAAEAQQRQAAVEAEAREAMAAAEEHQRSAQAAIERTRERAQRVAEQAERLNEEGQKARSEREAELAEMYEELRRTHRELQETTREVARVSREVARARSGSMTYIYQTTQRPVIGVVLGDADENGIRVIGVSPDGPAERGGVMQGDSIVALNRHELKTSIEDGVDGLRTALKGIEASEPVILTVKRKDRLVDLTIVPEVREPLGWHSITRFPSAPEAPGEFVTVERIVVPELDTEKLAEQIENIRIEISERAQPTAPGAPPPPSSHQLELHELSELGDTALWDTNFWFGLPMTRGLKLAEVNPGLGEYFKADRGVLVLKADDDNDLQLESGDVILDVGETAVNSPAEFMRALREVEPGEEVELAIKRERKNRTLKSTMPERKFGFFSPDQESGHTYKFNYSTD
ncbi:MAG: PDZ domain-containing protein [Xanthomonadales bacterium]|nr:PDZ domain-containing protein [Xanthomonadales bacterium]